jgi:orotate phosphoribosyltransferase-like protein
MKNSKERLEDESLEMRLSGKSWKEIADLMNISADTAKRWASTAARRLRRFGIMCPDLSQDTIKAFTLGIWDNH